MLGRRAAAGFLGALIVVAPAAARAQGCETLLPRPEAVASVQRAFLPEDLIRLRDIGVHELAFPAAGTIALSPDGKQLAFQIRQAEPVANRYCLGMIIIAVDGPGVPRTVDRGGELIRQSYDFRGKAGFPTGNPLPIVPRWSPDGRWIAFLKRTDGVSRVWRAWSDGRGSEPLTKNDSDVVSFAIGKDQTIIYATEANLDAARRMIAQEGLVGFRYDDRYSPMSASTPFPAAPISRIHEALSPDGAVRATTAEEVRFLAGQTEQVTQATSRSGRRAWVEAAPNGPVDAVSLIAQDASGASQRCAKCGTRIGSLWWSENGRDVLFFAREGWATSATALYRWRPGQDPTRLMVTNDSLADCLPRAAALICLREGSTQPRRIEQLQLGSMHRTVLFDPNPEIRSVQLGHVERLYWKNANGIETYGDLVLPVGYRQGTRYPLVVVQYESRGFLRGGTGDEYPIQAFANRGFAVLSFNRPKLIGLLGNAQDVVAIERANLENFADRRSVHSSLEIGINLLVARGIVDPGRVGITGVSDGMATTQFGLVNSSLFAAAAVGNPGFEPSMAMMIGPSAAREFAAEGFPRLTQEGTAFWKQISLARNAAHLTTPLLLQVPDNEYLAALESVTALREQGRPVDMYVFPNETHIKWQPAHRLAVYRRSLDWFDYWLRGVRSSAPDRQIELARWDEFSKDR